jgi:hypothetical protein
MKIVSKKVSDTKRSDHALSAAQTTAAETRRDAFFSMRFFSTRIAVIRVRPSGEYSAGKIGEPGFCSRTAQIAAEHYGVWIEA